MQSQVDTAVLCDDFSCNYLISVLQSELPEITSCANCSMNIITQQMMSDTVMRNSRRALLRFTALGLISFFSITAAASAQNAEPVAEKALAVTVYLEMADEDDNTIGFGSGFLVGQSQIATNFHVIVGAAKGTAKLAGTPTEYTIEGITATDEENDLAILKVTALEGEPLPLGDSDTVKVGETVYVVGSPKGLDGTSSYDTIRNIHEGSANKRFQMTALISPGSSGGPILNGNSEVIGISLITLEDGQNRNFAIPSNHLKELLAQSGRSRPLWQRSQSISAETHLRRGYAKYRLDQYQDAIADYDTAIDLKPDIAAAYYLRGTIWGDLVEHFTAIQDYNKAIDANPDYAFAYLRRGIANYLLDRNWAAKKDWNTALELAEQTGNKRLKTQTEKLLKRVD